MSPHLIQCFLYSAFVGLGIAVSLAGVQRCSHFRPTLHLDILILFDRTMPVYHLEVFSNLLRNEFSSISLYESPLNSSRIGIVGFDGRRVEVIQKLENPLSAERLDWHLQMLRRRHSEPSSGVRLASALRLSHKILMSNRSSRDVLVIIASSARSVDSETAAIGAANSLRNFDGAQIITLNYDDENSLFDGVLGLVGDKGRFFAPYREPHFDESFRRAIDYANCRCPKVSFEEGKPLQQLAIFNYTSNHVDYFANCIGGAEERRGTTVSEWCRAVGAEPLYVPPHLWTHLISKTEGSRLYEFVVSFVILNNAEMNDYNGWFIAEPSTSEPAEMAVALSRPTQWDYIEIGMLQRANDVPFICQRKACDSRNPCREPRRLVTFPASK